MDWNKLEEEYKSDFKPYVEDGKYTVVLDSVTQKTTSGGSIVFEFNFQEDENCQYPKISRFLFKDEKKNFRMLHYRNIMMVLGAKKEAAQKAVETCESKANREAIADTYTQTFNRLAQKHPKVELVVTTETNNGKDYAHGEFADKTVRFSNSSNIKQKPADELPSDDEIPLDGIPF